MYVWKLRRSRRLRQGTPARQYLTSSRLALPKDPPRPEVDRCWISAEALPEVNGSRASRNPAAAAAAAVVVTQREAEEGRSQAAAADSATGIADAKSVEMWYGTVEATPG